MPVGVAVDTELGLNAHLDLGEQRARRRVPTGEVDAGGLADEDCGRRRSRPGTGLATVAPAGQLDIDAGVVLSEAGDARVSYWIGTRSSATQPARMPLDVALPQPEAIRVTGREIADVQPDHAEARDLGDLPLGEEAVGDAALVEDLDGACLEAAGARAVRGSGPAAARRRRHRHRPEPARRPASGRSDRPPRSGHRGRSLACRRSASAEIVGEGRAVVNVRQPAVLRQPLAAAAAVPCHWPRRSSSQGCRAGQERRRLDTSPSSNRRRASVQDGSWRLEVQLLRVRSVCRKRAAWAPRSLNSLSYRSGAAIDQDPGGPAYRGGDP